MALKKGEKAAQKRFQPEIPKEGGKSVVAPLESRNEWSAGKKKKKEEKGEKESPMARRSADDFCLMVPLLLSQVYVSPRHVRSTEAGGGET